MQARQSAILHAFGGKLVGRKEMKQHVLKTLSRMPKSIIDFVTKHVWFITSYEDAWAFTFTGSDFQNKHVIFLSDELLQQDDAQIHWTIAHEIGHVVLGHKNRFSDKFGTDKVKIQEKEADDFAKDYVTKPSA